MTVVSQAVITVYYQTLIKYSSIYLLMNFAIAFIMPDSGTGFSNYVRVISKIVVLRE